MASEAHATADRRRLLNFIIIAVAMLSVGVASVVASVAYASHSGHQLQLQQQASCAFAADLGSAPLPSSPRPSRLGVSIIADSRAWWHRNDCPGTLPSSPSLARWAAYYHLPVS